MPRRICIVTGTRAEYGLLYWLMHDVRADPNLELQLVVTGMHLSPEFGLTYQAIEADGFTIDERVEMLLSSDTPVGIAKSIGLGLIGFADVFDRLRPDIVVLLGDRFEILAAAQAALVAKIPIAHIHGGETTEGAVDEAIRHSITKMAHIHFVAAEPYRRRVVQLGEDPERVINTGSPGLDHIFRSRRLSREQVEEVIGFSLDALLFVITYHPATLSDRLIADELDQLFRALLHFPSASFVFTKSNADAGGREINRAIDAFAQAHPKRARTFTALGLPRYLSTLSVADVVIGNSSSGLTEAPALNVPTVNIGDRQKGRLRAASVLDCEPVESEIVYAIRTALSDSFRKRCTGQDLPYGVGNASAAILAVLRGTPLGRSLVQKRFYDIAVPIY